MSSIKRHSTDSFNSSSKKSMLDVGAVYGTTPVDVVDLGNSPTLGSSQNQRAGTTASMRLSLVRFNEQFRSFAFRVNKLEPDEQAALAEFEGTLSLSAGGAGGSTKDGAGQTVKATKPPFTHPEAALNTT